MASTDDTIDAIYAASTEPDQWPGAVQRFGAALNAATGALYLENHGDTFGLLSSGVVFGHSAASIAAYAEYFCARNPFNVALHRLNRVDVLTDSGFDAKFGRMVSFHGGEYYHDWVRPQRLRHVIGQRVRTVGDAVLCAAFWRPADAGPFTGAEVADFRRIGTHLNRALDVGARLQTAEAEMEAMLGRNASAVFTLGPDGVVQRCNAVADALLRAGSGLVVRAGRLCAALPQQQAALDRLVACVFDPRRVAWAENARVLVHRLGGQPPLEARIVAVAHRFAPFGPDRTASAILTVTGFETEATVLTERLRRRFGLTAAQARLALTLRAGRTLQEAAAELGVGYETVRTHLKGIFERTGTRRQAELLLLLRREIED
jgi:DNA-binding CsgD family transcriptional regulator